MSSRSMIVGFFIGLAVFAGALWYFQTYAFYRDLPRQPLVIGGTEYPTGEWTGTEATSSPLKLRACLTLPAGTAAAILRDQTPAKGGVPLVAPYWFDCFDAAALGRDLESGSATAFLLGPSGAEGIDAWLVVYPDGRAYKWHQLSPQFANQ